MVKHGYDEPRVPISVVCGETVTERGTRKTVWFTREGSRWARLLSEGSETVPSVTAPGTIWQVSIDALLRPGSWLMRVDSFPKAERHLDPMQYLRRETRQTSRQVVRRYYRVQADGTLMESEPTPGELDSD